MQIWTTPEMCKLLGCERMPSKLLSEKEFNNAFLNNAASGDIAVLRLSDDYIDFMSAIKAGGMKVYVIFISSEPMAIMGDMGNAIVLDLKRFKLEEVRWIINLIMSLAEEKAVSGFRAPAFDASMAVKAKQITELEVIAGIFDDIMKKKTSVLMGLKLKSGGEEFTARGNGTVNMVKEASIVIHNIRPSAILWGMLAGRKVSMAISHRNETYKSVVTVQRVVEDRVYMTFPELLIEDTRNHYRIEPSSERTVECYMLDPEEPTISLKVMDISLKGAGFYSEREIKVGEVYSFTIVLPDPRRVVMCHGIIRARREYGKGFHCGVQFSLQVPDEEAIAQYIMNRDREIMGLLKDIT